MRQTGLDFKSRGRLPKAVIRVRPLTPMLCSMNMITKEELEKLILVDNLPYTKIAEIYSVSDVTIRT